MKNRLWLSIILSFFLVFVMGVSGVNAETLQDTVKPERVSIIVKGRGSNFKKISEVDPTARLTREFWIVDALVAEVKSSSLEAIRKKGLDFEVEQVFTPLKEEKVDEVNGEILQRLRHTTEDKGYDGRNTVIAVLDSGVDINHKDLSPNVESPKLTEAKVKEKKLKGKYYNPKIPYAYNYADNDNDIKDTNENAIGYGHGMHVIGIIGGNGPANDKGRVRGVAPQAQIASMKIFYNNPRKGDGAPEGAVISAIEDAVSLEVDAMNLSFGVPAGIKDDSDLMQKAINVAKKKGILVVAAAGNAYYAGYPNEPTIDNSTISSPGVADGAISVASYESEYRKVYEFNFNGETIKYTKLNGDIKKVNGMKMTSGGNGNADDIEENTGIVIIYRSGIQFTKMIENAYNKGAKAVIIYNKEGDDSYVENIGKIKEDIPVIFVSNTDGKKLLSHLEISPSFTDKVGEVQNPLKGMSAFSGYGPLNDLEIKPEITGIGGTVYSLANDHGYATMGGTSMAAPYVAGISLCYMNYLNGENTQYKPEDIRIAIMNSAKILNNSQGLPYAVRRQGAGIIDFENMKNHELRLLFNGLPKISLGEMEKEKVIRVQVENTANHSTKVDLSSSKLVTMDLVSAQEKALDGEITIEPKSFNLEAGGKKEVKVTIKLKAIADNYVEGFILAKTGKTQSNIPFLAYSGDFKNLSVFDKNFYEPNSRYKEQGLYSEYRVGGNKVMLVPVGGKKPKAENMSISPGSENGMLTAFPKISLLRNMKDVRFYIENDRHQMFTYLYATNFLRKEVTSDQKEKYKMSEAWRWNGTYYDKKQGLKIPAPEGQYYYVIEGTPVVDGAKKQVLRFPVKIDKTVPTVQSGTFITDTDVCEITMTGEDRGLAHTDISHFVFVIDKSGYKEDGDTVFYLDKIDGEYRKVLRLGELENGIHKLYVGAVDYAGNMGTAEGTIISVKNSPVKLSVDKTKPELQEKVIIDYQSPNAVTYRIYLNATSYLLAETEKEQFELSFSELGKQTVIVEALDSQGKSLGVNAVEVNVGEKNLIQGFEIKSKYKIENNKIETTWDVYNKHLERKTLTLITCAYGKDNKLLNMVAATNYIEAFSQDQITNGLKLPKGTVKVINFVWDDFVNLNSVKEEEVIYIDKEEEYLDVFFETNGGSKVDKQSVKKDEKAVKPATPSKAGYIFAGWYVDKALSQSFDFDFPISVSLTLYAKWEEIKKDEEKGDSGYIIPIIPIVPEEGKKDETTAIVDETTPLSPNSGIQTGNEGKVNKDTKTGSSGNNSARKKYHLTKVKTKRVLTKLAKKFKKVFTKQVYKIKLYVLDGKSGKYKLNEIRIPYKKSVKGYRFIITDIKTGKRYKARYDKKRKELIFKTDKEGTYAVLKQKIKKK